MRQFYAIASPFSAFISFTVFATQSDASINDPMQRETLNWWTGFTLLIAVGTLTYITLVHILPEVYFMSGHEEHDHFGNGEHHSHGHGDDDDAFQPSLNREQEGDTQPGVQT